MLRPCVVCHRHVSSTVSACAFCGAALSPIEVRALTTQIGRASRAMIFAGAIAVAPGACSNVEYQPIPSTAGAQANTGRLKGRLVQHNGKPAASYTVTLHGPHQVSVSSDANGSFIFDDVPPGEYYLATYGLKERRRIEIRSGQMAITTIELEKPEVDPRHMAKPYGAPPARRRNV